MRAMRNDRPSPDEHRSYFAKYIAMVPDGALPVILTEQTERLRPFYAGISEEQARARYADGKWSVKQVVGHLMDTERMFGFRAFAFSRNEQTPLFSFEQDDYVRAVDFDARPFGAIVEEFAAVRQATIALFTGMTPEMLQRRGSASGATLSARACGYIIAGHEVHHTRAIREQYLA
jgi:uncharacterized damage-inducible protein DinB